ncbi:MAG TPA: ABC transporter permease [Candidatus Acidoferrum sp.]|nr:ABC transporter permease [Candidatus Acidoferrum sp.]
MLDSLRQFAARLRSYFSRHASDNELESEMAAHLQFAIEENLEKGMAPQEAERQARISFGGLQQSTELHRESRGLPFLDSFLKDVQFGVRMLRKSPSFTLAAILTLALGIGANTVIFSAVYSVLLRPIPFRDPGKLVFLMKQNPPRGWDHNNVSAAEILAWRSQSGAFQDLGAFRQSACVITGSGDAQEAPCEIASSNLFPILGAIPFRGRFFAPGEDAAKSARVAILSYGFWQQHFAGDPEAVGRSLTINGISHTVVGIMPANFSHLYSSPYRSIPELWISGIALSPELEWNDYSGVARLKDSVTVRQAQSQLDAVSAHLELSHPVLKGWRAQLLSFRENISGNARPALLLLMGAVIFVLLIACANLANLLLARGAARTGEFAVRNAVGAEGWRLVRQLLTENLVLSLAGGLLGIILAFWGCQGMVALAPESLLNSAPGLATGIANPRVLAFTIFTLLLTTILFGLAPAFQAVRLQVAERLNEVGRAAMQSSRSHIFRQALVISEISLATILLIGAGLMVRTLASLNRTSLGFDISNLLTLRVPLSGQRYESPAAQSAFWERLTATAKNIPGVESATSSRDVLVDSFAGQFFTTSERPNPPAGQFPEANYLVAGPEYFKTTGVPVRKGRVFREEDNQSGEQVTIVNEELANRYWPGQDPIGKKLRPGAPADGRPWLTVIGVVGNVLSRGPDGGLHPEFYVSDRQIPWMLAPHNLIVRYAPGAGTQSLTQALVRTIHEIDSNQPVVDVSTMTDIATAPIAQQRMVMTLLVAFAALALILATIGTYSVISYSVSQRTREFGLRMALGAQTRTILRQVLGNGAKLLATGLVVGIAASLFLTRLMTDLLFGVKPADPSTFAVVVLTLAAISLFACYVPGRRASRVDPAIALRYE